MNKVYRVIWSAALHVWVAVSELTRGAQKTTVNSSNTHQNNKITKINHTFKNSAIALSLFSALGIYQQANAINVTDCLAMGAACTQVSNETQLNTALTSGSASTILFTGNITLTSAHMVNFVAKAQQDITIDGGGYTLTYPNSLAAFNMSRATTNGSTWASAAVSVNFVNFASVTVPNGSSGANKLFYVDAGVGSPALSSNVNITIDNVGSIPDGMLVSLGNDVPSGVPALGKVVVGNITNPATITSGAYRQTIVSPIIDLVGHFNITQTGNSVPAIFWSNGTAATSLLHFESTSDVSLTGSILTNGPADNTSAKSYNFQIDDGATLRMNISGQNPLGVTNYGVQIGSYDVGTRLFGSGATLIMSNQAGDVISNAPSTLATSIIYNGPTSPNDVIYNLAAGSSLAVTGAGNAGIDVSKTGANGTGNIYIRSNGVISSDGTDSVSATVGTGINVSEASTITGLGYVVILNDSAGKIIKSTGISLADRSSNTRRVNITNAGTITSSTAGIALTSTYIGKLMNVDNTGGVINANAGSAISVGDNIMLTLIGGTINTTGTTLGVNFLSTIDSNSHQIRDITFNINGTGNPLSRQTVAQTLNLSGNTFNSEGPSGGTVFPNAAGVYFSNGTTINTVNLSGTNSIGITSAAAGFDLTTAYLNINANVSGSKGIVKSGSAAGAGNVTIGPNVNITAVAGASAITFNNTIAESLINNGVINGSVTMGANGNTITNNGTLGSLTSTAGDDALTLNASSINNGIISLGTGNNTVDIYDGATINEIDTGSGNDIFNIYNLTNGSNTSLGNLNAIGGTNTLNFINSTRTLAAATKLQNFTNVNLDMTSAITLSDVNNITSGNINFATTAASQLFFSSTYDGAFSAILAGAVGTAEVLAGANVILNNASTFAGKWLVDIGGVLNSDNVDQLGTAAIDLNGTLNLSTSGTFNNALTGNSMGLLNVSDTGGVFNFGAGVGSDFTGTVNLSDATLNLSAANTLALSNATLMDSAGSVITMAAGTHNVGNLTFNGGDLQFSPGAVISTVALSVLGGSTIQADPVLLTAGNMLDLDFGAFTDLVQSSNALPANQLALLQLQDLSGNSLASGTQSYYQQNTVNVAMNTYNFSLVSNYSFSNQGLSISEQLTQSDILDGQTLSLTSAGTTSGNTMLEVQLTGSGNLAIGADNVAMSLNNATNSYTGTTTVNAGSLTLGASGALGNTSALDVLAGATVNLAGSSQTVGSLANAGTIDFAGGTLDLTNGGTLSSASGGLIGAGALNVQGGILTATTSNSGFTGQTTIASGASALLAANNALGTGGIAVDGTLNLNVADAAFANALTGTGLVNANAAIQLTGDNSTFAGTFDVNTGSSLTATSADNLGFGSVDLLGVASQLVLSGVDGAVGSSLSGVVGSIVDVVNGGITQLTGNNTGFNGQFAIDGTSTMLVNGSSNLGAGSVAIAAGGQLTFDAYNMTPLPSALNNTISGAGTWLLNNSNIDLSNNTNASGFGGTISISNASTLTMNGSTSLGAAAILNVASSADTLNVTTAGAYTLNNALTGAGTVNVDTSNGAFSLGNTVGNAFTGNMTLQNTTFSLASSNNAADLANASLTLNGGSVTTVGTPGTASTEQLNALTISGGTLNFTGGAPSSSAESTLTVNTLAATSGVVNVTGGSTWTNTNPVVPPNLSILDQNRGTTGTQLMSATTASGAGNLTLQIDGVAVSAGQGVSSAIQQGGQTVANGIYNYGLSNTNSANAYGLYLNYGLTQLDLLLDNADALIIATDVSPTSNKDLTAQITGVGGVVFDATNGALTVSNTQNNYTGTTTATGGSVLLGANNALGNTSLLTTNSGATLDINGYTQAVGALNNAGTVSVGLGVLTSGAMNNTGEVDLAGGTLNLTAGGTSSSIDGLAGAGTLNLTGGTLTLSAANSTLSAATNIASGATLALNNTATLGTSAVDVAAAGSLDFNGNTPVFANLLSGAGTIHTNTAVQLTGANTFTGQHGISADGILTITAANNLGTSAADVKLATDTSQLIFNGVSGDVANTISGMVDSTITVNNAANMSLSGNNSLLYSLIDIIDNSTLGVSETQNLGASTVTIDTGSTLLFDTLASGVLTSVTNTINGTGTWALSGSNIGLTGSNVSGFLGTVMINNGSVLNLDSANLLNNAATVNIVTANDTLNINNSGDFTFDNLLQGAGVMNVNTNNNVFSFGNNVGNAFTGQVNLQNTQFLLSNNNTVGNTNATLNLETGSTTTVGTGTQTIGALDMNGGTLVYNSIIDNAGILTSEGTIAANTVNTTGGGTVSVALPANVSPSLEGLSVLSLDTGAIVVDLVKGAATGTGRELTLTDGTGTPITQDYLEGITNPNSATVAALGTFKFGLTTGAQQDGLYVNYGLQSMELLTTGSEALVFSGTLANNGTPSNDMIAQITGSGDLAIDSPNDGTIVTLSATTNNYTGATLVRSGILQLNADAALGSTSNLALSSGTTVNLNTHTQTVGALNSDANSTLNMGGGTLTVSGGGNTDGVLTGAGNLVLSGGTLTLNADSPAYTGNTTINNGATAALTQVGALGVGGITVDGTLNMDSASGNLTNVLQGSGDTLLSHAAAVTLAANNSNYAGTFTTQAGTTLTATSGQNFGSGTVSNNGSLVLNTPTYWQLTTPISGTGTVVKEGSGTVQINNSNVTAGTTVVQAGTLLIGTIPASLIEPVATPMAAAPMLFAAAASSPVTLTSDVMVEPNGTFGGDGQVVGNVTNSGNILVGRSATGVDYSDLTINGNYVGNNGNITFNSVLAEDTSPTDRLVVSGNTSGASTVTVNNIGGRGAQNTDGIEIISVGGTSAGTFTLNGRAVAGALEYFLYQGTAAAPTNGNWYLRSNYVAPAAPTYRPESGGYIANIAAANTLFNTRLDDISGSVANDTAGKETTLWLHQSASRNKFKDDSGQLSNSSNRFVTQLGGEVWKGQLTGADYVGLGVMAGYARSTGTTDATNLTYKSDNSLTGYSLGVYGTWYQNAAKHNSPYVHTWLQYEWFEGSVSGDLLSSESYHLRGVSTSVEGGYPFQVYQLADNSGYITPEAQFTLNGAKMSDLTENNGTVVQQRGQNNLQTRLGAKFSNDTQLGSDKEHKQILTTYMDLNWIHNTRLAGVSMNSTGMQQTGSRHLIEVKLGVEGKVNDHLSVWGNLANQIGQQGYDDKAAMLGVRYKF